MKNYTSVLITLSFVFLFSCKDPHEGYKKQKEGFYSQLLTLEDNNNKIKKDCFIQFNWLLICKNDTLINERIFKNIDAPNSNGGMLEALGFLNEKEKGNFIFPTSKLEKEFKRLIKPELLKDSAHFVHQLCIDKIFSKEEYSKNKFLFSKWINNTKNLDFKTFEKQLIQDFLKKDVLQFHKSTSGLYFKIIPNNSGNKLTGGDPIHLKYTGGPLLRNDTFQDKEIVQDFSIGQELQVIKAIEETLLHMCYGDSAVLVSPSGLAFGNKGSSNGLIPPYSPVVYYLKVANP